jgi:hypothetical protein
MPSLSLPQVFPDNISLTEIVTCEMVALEHDNSLVGAAAVNDLGRRGAPATAPLDRLRIRIMTKICNRIAAGARLSWWCDPRPYREQAL